MCSVPAQLRGHPTECMDERLTPEFYILKCQSVCEPCCSLRLKICHTRYKRIIISVSVVALHDAHSCYDFLKHYCGNIIIRITHLGNIGEHQHIF